MADTKIINTKFNPKIPKIIDGDVTYPNEKVWQHRIRCLQGHNVKKSRYPPFSIEHMSWERQRLDKPMTEEDRFLRKQWLRDQNLSPNEPRYVRDAVPMCRGRRLVRLPWDAAEVVMAKITGPTAAEIIRGVVPKVLLGYVAFLGMFYHITYSPKSWESKNGFFIYGKRRPRIPGEDNSHLPPDAEVFSLRGFDKRTSHLDGKTSAAGVVW